MRIGSYKTSNPAFSSYFWPDEPKPARVMTISGIVLKSLFGILVIIPITAYIWYLHGTGFDVEWFTLSGMIASLIISIIISYRSHLAPILVPIYFVSKACFLGGFSAAIQARYPEMPYQAIGVTLITFLVMLLLYQTRIITVTEKLRSVIVTAAASIFLVYVVSWILGYFGMRSFVWGTSWYAIVFNCIAAIVAAFTFLLDFDFIERHKNQAPKHKESLATWGLLVSLIWLYVELLRLMRKLAIRS